jgi:ribosomal protein S18 acetylase RimI-like enzyme
MAWFRYTLCVASQTIALRALRGSPLEDEAAWYELHAAIRAQELGMESWEPALRTGILRQQLDAQRQSYRERFPDAEEQLILRGGTPIGWLIVDRSASEVRCIDIALLPAARGQGIGTLIIRDLQQEAAIDDRPMLLEVLRENARARALYERLGFQAMGGSDTHVSMEWHAAPLPTEPASFETHLGTALRIDLADGYVSLRIAEVADRRSRDGMERFSVFLHGPRNPMLPQGSYLVHHDALGSFVLFIVPVIGSDEERIVYEACFSRPAAGVPSP